MRQIGRARGWWACVGSGGRTDQLVAPAGGFVKEFTPREPGARSSRRRTLLPRPAGGETPARGSRRNGDDHQVTAGDERGNAPSDHWSAVPWRWPRLSFSPARPRRPTEPGRSWTDATWAAAATTSSRCTAATTACGTGSSSRCGCARTPAATRPTGCTWITPPLSSRRPRRRLGAPHPQRAWSRAGRAVTRASGAARCRATSSGSRCPSTRWAWARPTRSR